MIGAAPRANCTVLDCIMADNHFDVDDDLLSVYAINRYSESIEPSFQSTPKESNVSKASDESTSKAADSKDSSKSDKTDKSRVSGRPYTFSKTFRRSALLWD